MDRERTAKEWLESLDPAEFQEIVYAISDIQHEREEVRRSKLEERRDATREKSRSVLATLRK